jgi:high-affinity nickel-transport protein
MGFVILLLHVVGFGTLLMLGVGGRLAIGIGVTAYALGLRHALDADHLAAIDNTTRKLMSDGKRPTSVGFWFSLGHSTVVLALAVLLAVGVRAVSTPTSAGVSSLRVSSGWIGTLASGSFLYAIAAVNLFVLIGIVKTFGTMRKGRFDDHELEQQLSKRGFMNRIFGGLTRSVSRPAQMYPIGLVFGLGFDTATEVALLALAGGGASAGLPWYGILCLPILFAAGMSLLDSIDGSFMNFAYGWALSNPLRKLYYNITVTGLSVAVAMVIGTIELGGLTAGRLGLSGSFWTWLETIDLNTVGILIIGLFLATWALAVAVWKFARLEESMATVPRREN